MAFSDMILNKVVEAFLEALVNHTNDATIPKLKSDSARNSLKQAFGISIQRYASGHLRLGLTRPLLAEDGFLTLPIVAEELTQLLRFERNPDAEIIGRQWKAALENPPIWCDFTYSTPGKERLSPFPAGAVTPSLHSLPGRTANRRW